MNVHNYTNGRSFFSVLGDAHTVRNDQLREAQVSAASASRPSRVVAVGAVECAACAHGRAVLVCAMCTVWRAVRERRPQCSAQAPPSVCPLRLSVRIATIRKKHSHCTSHRCAHPVPLCSHCALHAARQHPHAPTAVFRALELAPFAALRCPFLLAPRPHTPIHSDRPPPVSTLQP